MAEKSDYLSGQRHMLFDVCCCILGMAGKADQVSKGIYLSAVKNILDQATTGGVCLGKAESTILMSMVDGV